MDISAEDYKLASGEGGVDRAWYLKKYPEVATAGVDPVEHYLLYGRAEGRDPRPDFSTSGYLEANSAVEGNPLVHYLRHGGKKVAPPEWRFAEDYNIASGDGGVDRAWYLQKYPEVAIAGVDPVEHYLRYGRSELRDPRPNFSTSGYLVANKDVEGNPLVHYLKRRIADPEEAAVTDWYRLWEKGYLYPKGGQQPPANTAFGTPGIPKILFTGHEASRTGAPLILLRLMQAMQRLSGAELFLILERGGAMLEDYVRIAHVLVNHNGMLYLPNGPDLAKMLGSIAGPPPTFAICNSADAWRLTKALREAGLPHIISLVHERVVHFAPDVWRTIHRCSNRVVFPADAVKAATTAVLPDFHDACVVPQGLLDPEFGRRDRNAARVEVRSTLGLASDTAIVLGCGTRDLRKGIDLFVQLAALVRARATRSVHFVWLGAEQYGAYFEKFIELDISQLNLSSTVSLVGEVTDPERYFLAADAFALTSRDDPFPCVIHEAMACALPIVVFDRAGGAKEAIADDCGIVLPYLDVTAMADTLVAFVDNPAQFADMGMRADARVRSNYRFLDYAGQIRQICDDVSIRPGEPRRIEPADTHSPSENLRSSTNFTKTIAVSDFAKRFWRLIRAHEWWHYKIPLALAVAFAFAWMNRIPFSMLVLPTGLMVLASASAGIWASVINDFTDLDQDRLAGKSTPMMQLSPPSRRAVVAGSVLLNAAAALALQRYPVSLLLLVANWITFVVYSVPPIRIKERGALGVIAIALGEHVLLGLLAVSLVLETTGMPLASAPAPWLLAYLGWSTAYGMRGIIWHQILEIQNDRRAGCKTLGASIGETRLARIGEWYVFPFEIFCFFLLLLLSHDSIFPVLLPIYAITEWLRCKCWGCNMVIAAPKPNMRFIMLEYYQIYFPFAFLILALRSDRSAIFLIVAFILIFPGPIGLLLRHMGIIFRWRVYEPIRIALSAR